MEKYGSSSNALGRSQCWPDTHDHAGFRGFTQQSLAVQVRPRPRPSIICLVASHHAAKCSWNLWQCR
jgi:membrane-associated PAP2 superfamily phosphatase